VVVNGVNGVSKPLAVNDMVAPPMPPVAPIAPPKIRRTPTAKESAKITKAYELIDETESIPVGSLEERTLYEKKSEKRKQRLAEADGNQRKRRRTHALDDFNKSLESNAEVASARFRVRHLDDARAEIQERDHQSEKERKKDMQRKRRREQQMRSEAEKINELEKAVRNAEDPGEHRRLLEQLDASSQKLRKVAEVNNGLPDGLDVPPMPHNYEGGMTSSFAVGTPEPDEPPKKRAKQGAGTGQRPKKSKEKKQAEIERAEAGYYAALEDQPVLLAPKEEERKDGRSKRTKEAAGPAAVVNFESKGYNQIYEQIVRDMARKDIPKVHRIKQTSLQTRQENMRKTAILASKQARKWQERTNKSMKDTQARAKRVMREMMSFWKRNEREERDLRRMAERKEIEDAKKAEADREANRQKRKLNFLISQTELYSHFIGRKIKTDEIENSTNDPDVASTTKKIGSGDPNAHTVDLPDSVADLTGKTRVTNFEDLDFDAEDETALREAAMANAQNAVKDAQDRARAFDGEDQMAAFDNSDMNFQNPTMAGDVQVTQPKMLQAQLKEYQLKGLNWLVNLYEQGINGILADEMGLGKTVQSISVMGYLAEQHNVWGPFLVIAPASTLHNWQQEITRFVPTIKVLPYWGNAKDRKILRKFWDRKHITYNKDSEFHVLVTSYQLVVQDAQYFQKIKWQYMILDEAQAIKSSSSSRWKTLLGFHCRNRLLLTGTPIQNNMQELWALLHFIMPTLFDSHDEFSDWFSKDIESHAQSNTKLNQDQLKRLHMILKPFMLRRVKAHVQKELGDKVEKDVFCDLTYRQRAMYANLRSKISIMDLLEKAAMGDDQDTATLMNLVMQFRKVCNHPDLFERADVSSPFSYSDFAETASFLREGYYIQLAYSVRNPVQLDLPRMLCNEVGRLDKAGPGNTRAGFERAGFRPDAMSQMMRIWSSEYIKESATIDGAFSFLRFADTSASEAADAGNLGAFERAVKHRPSIKRGLLIHEDESEEQVPVHAMFNIVENNSRRTMAELDPNSTLGSLYNVSKRGIENDGLNVIEPAARLRATAPPIEVSCFDQESANERNLTMYNTPVRNAFFPLEEVDEQRIIDRDVDPAAAPASGLLPAPASNKARWTNISVPSMRRFVTDCGKLAKLDQLLRELKAGGHRVLLYFQMTRMIDLMEEYLTYRNYKYCRLDGSTKLEDRRDTVHDFQTRPEIFIFLLSTRAGGLGINLTSADTVIFYDSDWNPTIDSQAMDRAHRLGQTKQVTVYRLITRGTIEERIRKRAMQKEEVQRVVITGGDGGGVDFNTRDRRENRTKDIAMWLADDEEAAMLEQKERENAEKQPEEEAKKKTKKALAAEARKKRKGEMSLDDMYHEGKSSASEECSKRTLANNFL
jgi:chromatin-remodeling ATPase INO80